MRSSPNNFKAFALFVVLVCASSDEAYATPPVITWCMTKVRQAAVYVKKTADRIVPKSPSQEELDYLYRVGAIPSPTRPPGRLKRSWIALRDLVYRYHLFLDRPGFLDRAFSSASEPQPRDWRPVLEIDETQAEGVQVEPAVPPPPAPIKRQPSGLFYASGPFGFAIPQTLILDSGQHPPWKADPEDLAALDRYLSSDQLPNPNSTQSREPNGMLEYLRREVEAESARAEDLAWRYPEPSKEIHDIEDVHAKPLIDSHLRHLKDLGNEDSRQRARQAERNEFVRDNLVSKIIRSTPEIPLTWRSRVRESLNFVVAENTSRDEAKACLQALADLHSLIPPIAKAKIWRQISADIMNRFSGEGWVSNEQISDNPDEYIFAGRTHGLKIDSSGRIWKARAADGKIDESTYTLVSPNL